MNIFEEYRQPTPYDGIFKYVAPEGMHWKCCGTNYGKIIWGGKCLSNPYIIVKDKDETD